MSWCYGNTAAKRCGQAVWYLHHHFLHCNSASWGAENKTGLYAQCEAFCDTLRNSIGQHHLSAVILEHKAMHRRVSYSI